MTFEINQIFEGEYSPHAAQWCNQNNAYIEEVEKQNGVRRFKIVAIPEPTAEEIAAQELAQAKAGRAEAVSRIIVEVDGMTFDGDETSQDRMTRAITMFTSSGLPEDTTTSWVLADNTVAQVTIGQLTQALLLAGKKQTELWTKPYKI